MIKTYPFCFLHVTIARSHRLWQVLLLGRYFDLRENVGAFLFHRNRGFADLSYSISIGNGIKE